jgi:hypothetical protein
MTLLIEYYVIILLAEEVRESLGGSLLPVGRATTYIIIWGGFVTVRVILTLHHKPQCDIEGTKEKRTLALGVRTSAHRRCQIRELRELGIIKLAIRTGCNMQLHPNVTCGDGAYGYIS